MVKSIILRLAAVLLFALAYHWCYREFVHPVFDYAHYRYYARSVHFLAFIYFLTLVPAVFASGGFNPAAFGAGILYTICYVPGLLTMAFMWERGLDTLVLASVMLALGMILIFLSTRFLYTARSIPRYSELHPRIRGYLLVFTVLCSAIFLMENWPHMRLVGFGDVYDLRFESRDANIGLLSGYLTLWLSLSIVPYYSAVGVAQKKWWPFLLAIAISLMVYMGNGAKGILLMPLEIAVFGWLFRSRKDPVLVLSATLGAVVGALTLLDYEELIVLRSLIVVRTLSTGGWTLATYYEYFSTYGHTFYTHIGPIGAMFDYPYSAALGQLIGLEYSGSEEANFNANFWASDGFAAAGIFGLGVASLICAVVFYLTNRLTRDYDQLMISLWLTGFWLALLNSPISTSMLSGGWLMALIIVTISGRRFRLEGRNRTSGFADTKSMSS